MLFWLGLKPGAGPSWAHIGRAKPGPNNGFMVALAGLPCWKAKAKPSGRGFSVYNIACICSDKYVWVTRTWPPIFWQVWTTTTMELNGWRWGTEVWLGNHTITQWAYTSSMSFSFSFHFPIQLLLLTLFSRYNFNNHRPFRQQRHRMMGEQGDDL